MKKSKCTGLLIPREHDKILGSDFLLCEDAMP